MVMVDTVTRFALVSTFFLFSSLPAIVNGDSANNLTIATMTGLPYDGAGARDYVYYSSATYCLAKVQVFARKLC